MIILSLHDGGGFLHGVIIPYTIHAYTHTHTCTRTQYIQTSNLHRAARLYFEKMNNYLILTVLVSVFSC